MLPGFAIGFLSFLRHADFQFRVVDSTISDPCRCSGSKPRYRVSTRADPIEDGDHCEMQGGIFG